MLYEGVEYVEAQRFLGEAHDPAGHWPGYDDGAPPPSPHLQLAYPADLAAGMSPAGYSMSGNLVWGPSHVPSRRFLLELDWTAVRDPAAPLAFGPGGRESGYGVLLHMAGEGWKTGQPPLIHLNHPYPGDENVANVSTPDFPFVNLSGGAWPARAIVPVDFDGGEDEGGGHLFIACGIWGSAPLTVAVRAWFPGKVPARISAGGAPAGVIARRR